MISKNKIREFLIRVFRYIEEHIITDYDRQKEEMSFIISLENLLGISKDV